MTEKDKIIQDQQMKIDKLEERIKYLETYTAMMKDVLIEINKKIEEIL